MFKRDALDRRDAQTLTAGSVIAEHVADLAHGHIRRIKPFASLEGTEAKMDEATGARRIVVVEDNADVADALRLWLELACYRVQVVRDGEAAVTAARAFSPHVMLCDIGLPGALDGHAVARAVREWNPPGSMLLIALSGEDGAAARARATEAGFDAYFEKPVDFSELGAVLAKRSG